MHRFANYHEKSRGTIGLMAQPPRKRHYLYLILQIKGPSTIMQLTPIDRVESISPQDFKKHYLRPQKPVIITSLSQEWPAYTKWNWDYFKSLVGNVEVEVYNNIRAGAKVPVNGSDGRMLFGEYLD